MHNVFAQSVLVSPPIVLGRQMRHFSAFHALLLLLFDSPFFKSGIATRDDVIFAIWICGTEFRTGAESLFGSGMITDAEEWGKSVGEWEFDQTIKDFRIYLADYLLFPSIWQQKGGKQSNIPWPFKLVCTILQNFSGFNEVEVWNMPLSRAACYRAAFAEDVGAELVSEKTLAIIAANPKDFARRKESG